MTRKTIAPKGLFDSSDFGFAQVCIVETPLGAAVHVSGQVAWDADRRLVGKGNVGRQLQKALENLGVALESAGANLEQVGSLRLYIKQTHIGETAAIGDALKAAFGGSPPCATWIATPGLANDEFLIEVEPSVVLLPRS